MPCKFNKPAIFITKGFIPSLTRLVMHIFIWMCRQIEDVTLALKVRINWRLHSIENLRPYHILPTVAELPEIHQQGRAPPHKVSRSCSICLVTAITDSGHQSAELCWLNVSLSKFESRPGCIFEQNRICLLLNLRQFLVRRACYSI